MDEEPDTINVVYFLSCYIALLISFYVIFHLVKFCHKCCCTQNHSYDGDVQESANPPQPQIRQVLPRESQSISVNPRLNITINPAPPQSRRVLPRESQSISVNPRLNITTNPAPPQSRQVLQRESQSISMNPRLNTTANPARSQSYQFLWESQTISVNPGQPRGLREVQLMPKQDVDSVILDMSKIMQSYMTCHDCVICLDSFDDNGGVKILEQCGHRFHSYCIQEWLSKHRTCPLCRTYIRNTI